MKINVSEKYKWTINMKILSTQLCLKSLYLFIYLFRILFSPHLFIQAHIEYLLCFMLGIQDD